MQMLANGILGELISEMGYKNVMSNFHIGNRDRDKKKQVVLTSPPKSVGMHSAHRAAAIFPFPTRCLVTGPLHRASLSPRDPSRGSIPLAAGGQ